MPSFYLQSSGSIQVSTTVNNERFKIGSKLKADPDKWVKKDQRCFGKNSRFVNEELDRIEQEIEAWIMETPTNLYSYDQVKDKLTSIINNTSTNEKRRPIDEYFKEFLEEKKLEVNPKTNRLLSRTTIRSYQTGFDWFCKFGKLELELINKKEFNKFLSYLLSNLEVNTARKYIKRMKTFFIWCDNEGLPINKEYKRWSPPMEKDTEDSEVRALNSEQLDRIYRLKIDPVEVYQIAKNIHKKLLTPLHVEQLCSSIEEARRQALAMASIGAHKESFWNLTSRNVNGSTIKYRRNKNASLCVAPFRDNKHWHAVEFANLSGGKLFKRMTSINYYLTYVKELCDIPFHITAKTFRKTFGSIIWYESNHPNKLGIIMDAYGHKTERETRRYLGIQKADLEQDHEEVFGF